MFTVYVDKYFAKNEGPFMDHLFILSEYLLSKDYPCSLSFFSEIFFFFPENSIV